VPGNYEVVLRVDGKTFRQPLTIRLDPRVRVNAGDLEAQLEVALMIDDWMNISFQAYNWISAMRDGLAQTQKTATDKTLRDIIQNFDKQLAELQEGTNEAPGFGAINRDVTRFVSMIQSADIRPARSIVENATPSCLALKNNLARLRKIYQDMPGAKPGIAILPNEPRCPN
jgi:hypothetical protein